MFKKAKKGFTIVELVIVIAVIGILSGILIPTFANLTGQAETTALKSNLAGAYAEYASEAADGKLDVGGDKIKMLGQAEVFLVPADKLTSAPTQGYIFNNEWQTQTVAFTTFSATGDQTPVVENANPDTAKAESTFGGYVFFYAAA